MVTESPFHSGELAVQAMAGEAAIARRNGTAITQSIIGGARPFLKQQPMLLLASRGEDGAMWPSVVFGSPGFMQADDGAHFQADLSLAAYDPDDPLWKNLDRELRLGALVIELVSRRRIRINGSARLNGNLLSIEVEESFPACPKYINRRHIRMPQEPLKPLHSEAGGTGQFGAAEIAILESVDTMFVATQSPEKGYDISHRGGAPGFARLVAPDILRWPEYHGNSMFNTLGNLQHDAHAGVIILDFVRAAALQLTGTATVHWHQPDSANETGGTNRFVELRIARWRRHPLPENLRSEFLDFSPFNPVARHAPAP